MLLKALLRPHIIQTHPWKITGILLFMIFSSYQLMNNRGIHGHNDVLPVINEREVYATFLSTRVGSNANEGEFAYDWYFNSTRVLIHRLLRNPSSRDRRPVVV